jgi:hypothetical protein
LAQNAWKIHTISDIRDGYAAEIRDFPVKLAENGNFEAETGSLETASSGIKLFNSIR